MRFVIYGAGAIGGAIGARLFQTSHDVVLIARGAHLDAIQRDGLLFRTPEGEDRLHVPAVRHPSEVDWRSGDIVILTMKTQDTEPALRDLEAAAGPGVPVICAQNGVENERLAARRFPFVYAMLVAMPATFLVPGEITASAGPLSGCLHAGCYPSGVDEIITAVCAELAASRFHCEPTPDVMALKYRKLAHNLGNGLDVITGRVSWGASGTSASSRIISATKPKPASAPPALRPCLRTNTRPASRRTTASCRLPAKNGSAAQPCRACFAATP